MSVVNHENSKKIYKKTLIACYLGFITQAIVANFAPLLFLRFHSEYGIPLGQIALISTTFFFTQLVVDLFCGKFGEKVDLLKFMLGSGLLCLICYLLV